MKKYKLLTIILLCIMFLSGCSSTKKSLSGEEFIQKCNEKGIIMSDYKAYYGFAKEAYQSNAKDYSILFVIGNKYSDITGMFVDEINNIYNESDILAILNDNNKVDSMTNEGKNWKSLEINTESNYYYLIYIENTLLYLKGTQDKKELLLTLKDAISY